MADIWSPVPDAIFTSNTSLEVTSFAATLIDRDVMRTTPVWQGVEYADIGSHAWLST